MATTISKELYGKLKDGQDVFSYTLSNSNGMTVQVMDYGATIQAICVPDKNGKLSDIVLGFDDLQGWESDEFFIGKIIGRFANRIAGGQFTLDGSTYKLFVNNGPNTNHGGKEGFYAKNWQSSVCDDKLVFTYTSLDGEEGFPGELTLTVTYSLDDSNALTIDYHATTTQATPVNFTSHAYYNLAGQNAGNMDDHTVTVYAERYLPTDDTNIPTGELHDVAGTEMDLRSPTKLSERLSKVSEGRGYDNCYCLESNGQLMRAARVEHTPSGRYMECHTTEPGMQFYTAYYLNDVKGKNGATYNAFAGFCLEAQHYPDSINQPKFPSVVLRPGEVYMQKTVYKFGLL